MKEEREQKKRERKRTKRHMVHKMGEKRRVDLSQRFIE